MRRTDIPTLSKMIGQLYFHLPLEVGARFPVRADADGLHFRCAERGAVQDWLTALRRDFAMPELQLWASTSWSEPGHHFPYAAVQEVRLLPPTDGSQPYPAVRSWRIELRDAAGATLGETRIYTDIGLYYTGYTGVEKPALASPLEGAEVYYRFTVPYWPRWISQYWEIEALEREGKLFLADFMAGLDWAVYPLIHHFCLELGEPHYRLLFEQEVREGDYTFIPAGEEAFFHFIDGEGQILSQSAVWAITDRTLEQAGPLRLGLFLDTPGELDLQAITVAPHSRVWIVWEDPTEEE
jgi:hypothetical protein